MKISQEAYQGSAQYTVAVDGKQIGDTQTAGALYGSGGDTITLLGDFGADAHTVTVTFLNDAWGGSADKDRNLHVDGITLNDTEVEGAVATLGTTGSTSFTVKAATRTA
nr:carbohydrate-binding domain-containing protein [Roseicella sp. DB1501]